MGQQLNKIIKRRRRAAYLKRKNELAKQGVTRRVARASKAAASADGEKKPAAKKVAAKKAAKAPAKKAAAKAEEGTATE